MGDQDESDSQPGIPSGTRAPRSQPREPSPRARRIFNVAGILAALAEEYRTFALGFDDLEESEAAATEAHLVEQTLESAQGLTELAADGLGLPPSGPKNGAGR
jgi:hypothetical protein